MDLLELINDDYKIDWESASKYVPLHTGKFLGESPILIYDLPSYIKIKTLIRLTDAEKTARDDKLDQEKQARELAKAKREIDRTSAKTKLKEMLTDDEITALFE